MALPARADDEAPTAVTLPSDVPTAHAGPTPTGHATPRTPLDASTTLALPKPETVLRRAEIVQTRRTAIAGLVFNTLGLMVIPWLGGDPTARVICIASLACAELYNACLLYLSDERRYHEHYVVIYYAVAPVFNAGVIYYLGVFGPILMMFVLNLYTACLSYGPRVAKVTLVSCILPMLVVGGLITAGVVRDPGMVAVDEGMGALGRGTVLVSFMLFLYLVYVQARTTREVMVASLTDRDEAVRRASHREALFLEARQDLERALQAGGLGRFTDQTLGSFRLGPVIGRGGMGEVYEATHVETGEPAAVKMLLPEVIGRPDYVRRFMREVRIAASLDSPHVVRVLEVGDESSPLPYLAMERLRGEDLAQILRRDARLGAAETLDLIRQVGRGLQAANTAGIVHRDLKPQNVFFTEGEPRTWKILDFGVSKPLQRGATLTLGEAVGTPQYMAPEQARNAEIDARTDLYSLATMVYRAITGHPPFRGSDVGELLVAVLTTMPVRPSALVRVPREVDLVLAIALAKSPSDRFPTAEAMAAALEAALSGRIDDAQRKRALALLSALPWTEAS